jgi:NAD(P)-dependent dehydrogenase (short-subunit alcohol dehydrogenase family)
MRVLVTGANRGIGHELVRQLVERGDDVDAVSRTPAEIVYEDTTTDSKVRVFRCDISDDSSVRALAADLGDAAIDMVINSAGVNGGPRQSLRDLDFAEALRTYNVDALGALRVTVALLPHLRRGSIKKLVHMTSGLGSIADNRSGGSYGYRMAKAALNMMSKSLAVELRDEGIASYVVSPGWVQTDMGGPHATVTAAESVRGMLRVIESATLAESGEFLDWRGGRFPY